MYRLAPELAIVQKVDFFPPVVDDPTTFGRIAAANSLSDVYAMGGQPVTAMNVVGYPDDQLGLEWLGLILQGGAERLAEQVLPYVVTLARLLAARICLLSVVADEEDGLLAETVVAAEGVGTPLATRWKPSSRPPPSVSSSFTSTTPRISRVTS